MNLGLLLPLGDSLKNFAKHGQDVRFVNYYLNYYCRHFKKVFVFSYENETYFGLPKNCVLICPSQNIHRYLYGLLLPIVQKKAFEECDVFRCFHPSATIPALVGKLIYEKKFIFNFNYDYQALAKVEGKGKLVLFLKLIEWLAFRFSDHVFVADEEMGNYAGKFVSDDKMTLVRNGADTTLFKPDIKKRKNTRIVFTVGRLDPAKNYGQLIEAISKIKPKVKLLIVGRGYLEKILKQKAAKLGVGLDIINMVPHDKLPAFYNSAAVYVQCSLREAPVKTLLEAMSCGRPCVGTDVPGIRDVISNGQDGVLTKLSVSGIKNGIESILNDSEFATRLGKNARQKIIKKYSLQKFLQLETEILLSI